MGKDVDNEREFKVGVIKKVAMGVIAVALMAVVFQLGRRMSVDTNVEQSKDVIVIDPGHGGVDPGKVGVNGALEKDINLSVSFYLKAFLEQSGYEVVMTRTEDTGLYAQTDSNKKTTDLKNRVQLINTAQPVVAVSVHQNSFGQESSKGAQAFYHGSSVEGKALAETIQEQIKQSIGDGNTRLAKSNESYYMLKNTECPLVIVECGFLSNNGEAALLSDQAYQEKMADAIRLGVAQYLRQKAVAPSTEPQASGAADVIQPIAEETPASTDGAQ